MKTDSSYRGRIVQAVSDFQRRKQPARRQGRKPNTRHELSALKEK